MFALLAWLRAVGAVWRGGLLAVVWLEAARSVDARPSIATYTAPQAFLIPLTVTAALAALAAPI